MLTKHLRKSAVTAFLLACSALSAHADTPAQTLQGYSLLGIDAVTGSVLKYDFSTSQKTTLGTVTLNDAPVVGIDAAAYFPSYQNIYVLWTNASGKNNLLYANVANAQTTLVAENLEGGRFTGACAFAPSDSPPQFFAMQAAKVKPPSTIVGLVNINPNNSNANEFTVTKDNGESFSRDNLASKNLHLAADGTYYQGGATLVHVKPKGNGNQNALVLNGEVFPLQNSNTYDFSGSMQIRVYNDKISNGKAMGHWWLQVISGTVVVNGQVQIETPNRITQINPSTGTVTEIMVLSKTYTGIATSDGSSFYALNNGNLYLINTTTQTETLVGSTGINTTANLVPSGSYLVTYNQTNSYLVALDPTTGQPQGSPPAGSLGALKPLIIVPSSSIPTSPLAGAYD